VLGPLHMFHLRVGNFRDALRYAQRGVTVAMRLDDPAARTLAHALAGISLHFAGELDAARAELETALEHGRVPHRTRSIYLGFDGQALASIVLARTLWIQGHPARGMELLQLAVQDAERKNHPVTLAITLIYAISVLLWGGDLDSAKSHVEWFIAHADRHTLAPYQAVGRGFRGRLALLRGDPKAGVEDLQGCIAQFHATRYELLTTPFSMALAEGFAALGRTAEAEALTNATIERCEANGDLVFMPDLLRTKGNLQLSASPRNDRTAEQCFAQALAWSRRLGAPALELRAAIDYAGLLAARAQAAEARALLRPAMDHVDEGSNTVDLRAGARLLAAL
jgi:hypothetical protein